MPNSPKTAARKAAMAAERRRLNNLRRNDPTGAKARLRRAAEQAVHRRRNNAARIIQARVRGMLTRGRMANPNTNIGRRAIMAMFARPNNMRAHGAAIRACIRYGPEHYVSGRLQPRWRTTAPMCHEMLYGPGSAFARSLPRGYFTRTRSPPRNRSPRRSPPRNPSNNNNNLYH